MKTKVILLLTHPCVADPRVEFCAKSLADMGFQTEILAWDRIGDAPSFEVRDNYIIQRLFVKSGFNRKLRQFVPLFQFYRLAYRYLKEQDECTILHCNDFDTLPLGLFLKITRRKKVVYDAHEIYCDMVFDHHPVLRRLCLFLERFFIQRVDIFFTVGEVRKTWYAEHGYKRIPVILGNWKQRPTMGFDRETERTLRGWSDKIVILYIGTFNAERNLEGLIRAVNGDQRFHLILGGDGTQKPKIIEMITGSTNIEYIGFVKDQNLMDYYNTFCDVIYYGLYGDSPISRTAVPNKMFEAIAFDKIFLTSPLGEMQALDRDGKTFVFIRDLEQQLNEIIEILGNPEQRKVITENYEVLYRKYCREKAFAILAEVYAGLVDDTIQKPAGVSNVPGKDEKVIG